MLTVKIGQSSMAIQRTLRVRAPAVAIKLSSSRRRQLNTLVAINKSFDGRMASQSFECIASINNERSL